MDKIDKTLLSGLLVTLMLPFVFTEEVIPGVYSPTFRLFMVPLLFFVIFGVKLIWKELENALD